MWTPGWMEMAVIGVIALLLFGKRLPEVMRSLGKGIVEFKKGVKGIEDDVTKSVSEEPKKVEPKSGEKEIK
ncbi:MAG TPA: Sec-independent protein translocase subunit TatA/TatB [Candidatus Brocadiia bacterium]|nr:twin-arginine translocase TatA/TatE family subunit [Planctomycetota bacterium]MBI4006880.1 twin-arginine translocase TatA/TatE family subunit [Planctomycetota bacterium]MDO8092927.1 twin-arginine translocase TatA/TatE family subunit [Candidatus Brocadiales bacterium]